VRRHDRFRVVDGASARRQGHASAEPASLLVGANIDRAASRACTAFGPQPEPEADANLVHQIVVDALDALLTAMKAGRRAMPEATRGQRINYVIDVVVGEPD
jgi:hypothetical protein